MRCTMSISTSCTTVTVGASVAIPAPWLKLAAGLVWEGDDGAPGRPKAATIVR